MHKNIQLYFLYVGIHSYVYLNKNFERHGQLIQTCPFARVRPWLSTADKRTVYAVKLNRATDRGHDSRKSDSYYLSSHGFPPKRVLGFCWHLPALP